MRRIIAAILLGSLLGTAQAQQPQPVPPAPQSLSEVRRAQAGYSYDGVCVFADLVGGYTLPALGPNFANDPHFHLDKVIPEQLPTGETLQWKLYTYKNAGIAGEAIGTDQKKFYFRQYRLDASRLPFDFRSKSYLMSILSVDPDQAAPDVVTLQCDAVSVEFHFNHDALQFLDISRASTD